MPNRDHLVDTSYLVLRVAFVANRLFMLALSSALLLSWVFWLPITAFLRLSNPNVDAPSELAGLRFEMLIGITMAIATDRLLANLSHIIASARASDPFNAANAHRLQAIGWSLLVLQVLDIAIAVLSRICPSLGSPAPSGTFSAGGWVAVLLVFVLARVFAKGSLMRDELAETI